MHLKDFFIQDFLYVTDLFPTGGIAGSNQLLYSVWFVGKKSQYRHRYRIKGQPRGVTVLSEQEDMPANISK